MFDLIDYVCFSPLPTQSYRYLALSCASALLRYIEYIQNATFARHSLRATYRGLESQILIDYHSSASLELIRNRRTGEDKGTLFWVLNRTKTQMGKRLLRASILQPVNDIATLQVRVSCVEEILGSERVFFDIGNNLKGFPDFEHVLSHFVHVRKGVTYETLASGIADVVHVRTALRKLPEIGRAIEECENNLLKSIANALGRENLIELRTQLDEIVDENVGTQRPGKTQGHATLPYAVRPGINGLLDASRRQYELIMEEINNLALEYHEQYEIPSLRLTYSGRRGFHLCASDDVTLPEHVFVQQTRQGKKISFSTDDMFSLNERIKEILGEIYSITDKGL
jgi:DNA mismatch repair protein MSH4